MTVLRLAERIRRQQEREERYKERIKDKYSNFRNLTQRWDDPENEFRYGFKEERRK